MKKCVEKIRSASTLIVLFLATMVASNEVMGVNLVSNGSFEDPGFTNSYNFLAIAPYQGWYPTMSPTQITGWTATFDGSGEPSYWTKAPSYTAYDGNYGYVINDGDSMETTFSAVAGTPYTLSFYYAVIWPNPTGLLVNVAGTSKTLFGSDGTPTSVYYDNPYSHVLWSKFTVNFTAASTDPSAVLKFTNLQDNQNTYGMVIDNVQITPEPMTMILMIIGGFLAFRSRVVR
ncbi:MAG: hypothetical protein WC975_00370 [Phycisphaerae bacterium]